MFLIILSHSIAFSGCEFLYSAYILPFFFVSGVTSRYPNINLHKRSLRLLVPYFFYSFFYILLFSLRDRNATELIKNVLGVIYGRISISKDINSSMNIRFNIALWFLPTMYVAYVILKVLKNVEFIKSSFLLLIYSGLCTMLPIILPWGLDIAPLCAWFILLGNKSKRYFEDKKIQKHSIVLNCTVVFGFVIYLSLVYINGNINLSISKFGQNDLYSYLTSIVINLLFIFILVVLFVLYGGGFGEKLIQSSENLQSDNECCETHLKTGELNYLAEEHTHKLRVQTFKSKVEKPLIEIFSWLGGGI